MSIGTGGLSKRRRKSSFVHSSMIDIMKRHMPESSKENLMAGAATGDATSQVHNEEKEVNIDGEPTPSLSDNRHSAGYSRRGGMQNAHRSSECMRTGEHLIIANAPRDLKSSVTTVAEHIDEIGKSDAEEEEECDVECRGNVTTGDISEGEVRQHFCFFNIFKFIGTIVVMDNVSYKYILILLINADARSIRSLTVVAEFEKW